MEITIEHKGNFAKTDSFLKNALKRNYKSILSKYAQKGVEALRANTPIDTGLTASSWYYEIVDDGTTVSIYWKNSNTVKGVNIAIILQYGHGTGTGGYVSGTDYINPALRPIFDEISESVWKEVTSN